MKISRILFVLGLFIGVMGAIVMFMTTVEVGMAVSMLGFMIIELAQFIQCSDIDKEI